MAEQVLRHGAPLVSRMLNAAAPLAAPVVRRRARSLDPTRTPFLVLGAGRTGSTLLRHLLNDHPGVHCAGEVLNVSNPVRQALPGAREHELLTPARLLHRRVFAVPGVTAAGFKLFYQHGMGSMPTAWVYLDALEDLRVIHLQRRDALARYVSLQRALRDGHWTRTGDSAPVEQPPFDVDPEHFVWWVDLWRERRARALERLSGRPVLEVWYEDLAADRAGQLAEVFAFLDVPAAPVEAALRKQRTRPLEEVVANWDDVVDAVEPWRWVS